METRYIVVTEIDWDVDNENDLKELPQNFNLKVTENDIEDITDIYELDEYVSDYITEKTGFCHRGFDMRIYYDTIEGLIYCSEKYDADKSESFYDMYDEDGKYYGELHRTNLDGLTAKEVEEQIELNNVDENQETEIKEILVKNDNCIDIRELGLCVGYDEVIDYVIFKIEDGKELILIETEYDIYSFGILAEYQQNAIYDFVKHFKAK